MCRTKQIEIDFGRVKNNTAAGYSGTPLVKKLGFGDGCRILLLGEPEDYAQFVDPLPDTVQFVRRPSTNVDIAHIFVTWKKELEKYLKALRNKLKSGAAVWVSWPKKSAKVPTDITEGTIREIALPLGYVDIKVCAVSDVWSGLKLVVRKELR